MACGCSKDVLNDNTVISRTCTSINVDLLQLWKRKVDCVIAYNREEELDLTEEEVQDKSDILQAWIDDKIISPDSCNFMENLKDMQRLVNSIIIKGICL